MKSFDLELRAWQAQLSTEGDLATFTLQPNPQAGEHAYVGIVKTIPTVPSRLPSSPAT